MRRKYGGAKRALVGLLAASILLAESGGTLYAANTEYVEAGNAGAEIEAVEIEAVEIEAVPAATGTLVSRTEATISDEAVTDDGRDQGGNADAAEEILEAQSAEKTISAIPTYSYDGTTLTISGTGVFTEADAKTMKADAAYKSVTAIVIEEGVSGLPTSCFQDTTASTVSIPSTVTAIPDSAFYNAKNLASLSLPAGVTEVDNMAFWHCTSLKSLELGKITKIGNYAFSGCTALTKVDFPDTLTSMGSNCFSNCSALTEITYPVRLTEGSQAFYNCSVLKTINWPEYGSKITIPSAVFERCGLEQIVLPDYVETIGAGAFYYNEQLTSVVIPDSVKVIDDRAFRSCKKLNSVTLGKNVANIGFYAFNECIALTKLEFPASVTEIETSAFSDCTGLSEITWPINATVMYKPFEGCTSLKNVTIPEGVKTIPELALYNTAITKITIPSTVTAFGGAMTFCNCANLTEVTILGKVKTIPASTFSGCKSLTTVTLPASVTEIKFGAFQDDVNLTTLNFGGTEAQWKKVKIENLNDPLSSENLKINYGVAGKPDNSSGEATVTIGGKQETVTSLAEAFTKITKAGDTGAEYTISLTTDMTNEASFTLPAKAAKVTIKGNGKTITLKAAKLTAKTDLVLDNVKVNVVNKKTGAAAKLTITAAKNLTFQNGTGFTTDGLTVKGKKTGTFTLGEVAEYVAVSGFGTVNVSGLLKAKTLSCQNLNLGASATLAVPTGAKVTVNTLLKGSNGAKIALEEGFKPLALKGEADGKIAVSYSGKDGTTRPDGTQIFTVTKKMTDAMLAGFDVSAMGQGGAASYGLARPTAAKACLYGKTIQYGADTYALWKDVIAKAAEKGDQNISVSLTGDTYAYGALKLPKAGTYAGITIDGGNHTLSFTGNVKLTAPMTLKNVALKGVTAKKAEKGYSLQENAKKGYSLTEDNVTWVNIIKK